MRERPETESLRLAESVVELIADPAFLFAADLSPRKSDPDLPFAPARETIQPSTALAVEKLKCPAAVQAGYGTGKQENQRTEEQPRKRPTRTHAPARDHHSRSSSPVILLLTPTDSTPTLERIRKTNGTPKHV